MMGLITFFSFGFSAYSQVPVIETGGHHSSPLQWVDLKTGHLIRLLSRRPGNNASYYFNNNPFFINTDGTDEMVFNGSGLDPLSGYQAFGVNLQTLEIKQFSSEEGRGIHTEILGRKTNSLYFQRGNAVYRLELSNGRKEKIFQYPDGYRGSISTVNADETFLAGVKDDPKQEEILRQNPEKKDYFDKIFDARPTNTIFIIDINHGLLREIHKEQTWIGHLQFSPVNPLLLMFCHEGPWQKVDRIWTLDISSGTSRLMHPRTLSGEIAGHEFFSSDGKIIWFDLQKPRSVRFYLGGVDVLTGKETDYELPRDGWSIHYNEWGHGMIFAGDGGDERQVARSKNGTWINLFRPDGNHFKVEHLVDMRFQRYHLEPNVHFSPDGKWVIFRANFDGSEQIYEVQISAYGK